MDKLEEFKDWWLANRVINTPVNDSLNFVADTHGVVLFRHNEFQVELFAVKPNSEIKPHIHPNVDSFEVFISGDINFMCNDEWFEQNIIGSTIRVKPNSFHGGLFGEKGGCFLSIQRWLNEVKPTFVGNDWADKESKSSYKDSAT
jgi:mannose-6-phosphate isomerase-like protein (cupin superfamily)